MMLTDTLRWKDWTRRLSVSHFPEYHNTRLRVGLRIIIIVITFDCISIRTEFFSVSHVEISLTFSRFSLAERSAGEWILCFSSRWLRTSASFGSTRGDAVCNVSILTCFGERMLCLEYYREITEIKEENRWKNRELTLFVTVWSFRHNRFSAQTIHVNAKNCVIWTKSMYAEDPQLGNPVKYRWICPTSF